MHGRVAIRIPAGAACDGLYNIRLGGFGGFYWAYMYYGTYSALLVRRGEQEEEVERRVCSRGIDMTLMIDD